MSNRQTECNKCKAAGFPNQMITFENLGEDPYTGKVKWKIHNAAGGDHIHKTKQDTEVYQYAEKSLTIAWRADKNRELLEQWYNQFSKTHNVRFSQSHAVALGGSVEYSICIWYEGGQE